MRYAMTFGAARSVRRVACPSLLSEDATHATVSSACRRAGLAFLAGVAEGWTKRDLAQWLQRDYAHATRHAQQGERLVDARGRAAQGDGAPIDSATIEDLLVTTRGSILAALERAVLDGGQPHFVTRALEGAHVERAVDERGIGAWVPVDAANMRLRERVASLFAADYLNDADTYASLYVCHRCETVVFEDGARERGMCGAHRNVSGLVPRHEPTVSRSGSRPRTLHYGE